MFVYDGRVRAFVPAKRRMKTEKRKEKNEETSTMREDCVMRRIFQTPTDRFAHLPVRQSFCNSRAVCTVTRALCRSSPITGSKCHFKPPHAFCGEEPRRRSRDISSLHFIFEAFASTDAPVRALQETSDSLVLALLVLATGLEALQAIGSRGAFSNTNLECQVASHFSREGVS